MCVRAWCVVRSVFYAPLSKTVLPHVGKHGGLLDAGHGPSRTAIFANGMHALADFGAFAALYRLG